VTHSYIPEDLNLQLHCFQNLKSLMLINLHVFKRDDVSCVYESIEAFTAEKTLGYSSTNEVKSCGCCMVSYVPSAGTLLEPVFCVRMRL